MRVVTSPSAVNRRRSHDPAMIVTFARNHYGIGFVSELRACVVKPQFGPTGDRRLTELAAFRSPTSTSKPVRAIGHEVPHNGLSARRQHRSRRISWSGHFIFACYETRQCARLNQPL